MPVGTVLGLICIRSASGIDGAVFDALAALPPKVEVPEIASVIESVKALPGVLAAIDAARSDPDDLYLTFFTTGDRAHAAWPGIGQSTEMRPDQSAELAVSVEFNFSQNVSLFDHDFSRDDHLGSITMLAEEQGNGQIAKFAHSSVEGSAYYITYEVN